jgi:hypothetical protein
MCVCVLLLRLQMGGVACDWVVGHGAALMLGVGVYCPATGLAAANPIDSLIAG